MKKCIYCGMTYNTNNPEWIRWNDGIDNGYCCNDCERDDEQSQDPERYSCNDKE